jgi:hypothetical protein
MQVVFFFLYIFSAAFLQSRSLSLSSREAEVAVECGL